MKRFNFKAISQALAFTIGATFLLLTLSIRETSALPRCGYNPQCFCLITYEECTYQGCGCAGKACNAQVGNCVGDPNTPCIYEACSLEPCSCSTQ